jgi:general stress protein YciG
MALIEEEQQQQEKPKKKNKKKPGLGSFSGDAEELRIIAMAGGKARAKDRKGLIEAAKTGGKVVLERYGVEHYQLIGQKGGKTVLERYSVQFFSDLGKKGNAIMRKKKKEKEKKKQQS